MRNKNKGILIAIMLGMLFTLTACGNEIPNLSEQDNAMVAQYAANLVMQYSDKYHSKLVDTSSVEDDNAVVEEQDQQEVSQDITEETAQSVIEGDMVDTDTEDVGLEDVGLEDGGLEDGGLEDASLEDGGSEESPTLSIAQVLGINGADIQYTGYEICDSYPNGEENPENMFFAMNANSGSKLVVLHLQVANNTAEPILLDTLSIQAKYRVVLNEAHTQNVLVTMLEDDFTAIKQDIAPQETMQAVVVAEVSQETADELQSVGLEIKSNDKKTVIRN